MQTLVLPYSHELFSLCQSMLKEKEHRKFHSDSTDHVLPILLEFSGSYNQSSAMEPSFNVSLSTVREKH